ncbi:uncharacterized protein [Apostichopus japonicus]|uniref:uncharacterized protein n=1 Tax=Stichopus japonicus TaxID=307972 RepID=UPI003AB82F26
MPCQNAHLLCISKRPKRKKWMKYRHPEICKVEGCKKNGQHFASLTKHLKSVHKMTRKKYEEHRWSVAEKKKTEKQKVDFYFFSLNSGGGCPATREERCSVKPKLPSSEEDTYPRYMYYQVYTESCQMMIISDNVRVFNLPEDEPHCITYHINKLIVSGFHEDWFRESMNEGSGTIIRGKEPQILQYGCGLCP